MNRDDIIRWAREAHRELVTKDYPGHAGQLDPWTMQLLEHFAALVAAAAKAEEREACAKLVEPSDEHRRDASWGYMGGNEGVELLDEIAAAIRARGEK